MHTGTTLYKLVYIVQMHNIDMMAGKGWTKLHNS